MKLKIIPKVKKEREKLHKQKSNSSLSGKRSGQRHALRFRLELKLTQLKLVAPALSGIATDRQRKSNF